MAKNRKVAENYILEYINEIVPGGENKKLYEKLFESMNDKEFDQFMLDLKEGRKKLSVISPNFSNDRVEVSRNLKLAKRMGHDFFQRIWIPAKGNIPSYLTPNKYMVVILPLRRQAQVLDKKISIPENNNSIDNMTAQPTGKSKGSKISYPEVQVLAALDQQESLIELMKFRGGDSKAWNAMNTMIARTGSVSTKAIEGFTGTVKSTQSLSNYLTGAHLKNTLLAK